MMQMLKLNFLENEGEHRKCSSEDLSEVSQVSRKMHICMQTQCYPVSKQ